MDLNTEFYPDSLTVSFPQSNPPPKSRSYSMVSQGSGSSPMSLRRPSQNPPTLFGWSQGHKGSSLYSSKRSLLPDHLMDAREVQHAKNTLINMQVLSQERGSVLKEGLIASLIQLLGIVLIACKLQQNNFMSCI